MARGHGRERRGEERSLVYQFNSVEWDKIDLPLRIPGISIVVIRF